MYRVLVLGSCLCPLLRGVPTPHRTQQGEDGGTHLLTGTSRSQTWGSSQSAPLHLQAGRVWFPSMVGSAHCGQQCREGSGTTRHFGSAVPGFQIPPAARASRLHSSVLCFGASGKLGLEGPTGEKRWPRACCVPGSMNTLQHPVVLKGPCNNQGKRALPQPCPHGAVPVHP